MSDKTAISWTDHTFNPWHGCVRVSPGCEHCYAEAFSKRTGHAVWGPAQTTPRRLFGPKHWLDPFKWSVAAHAAGERRRVFCASMADAFEEHPMVIPERARLWEVIDQTPWLDWQLLTKRPENIRAMVPPTWLADWPAHVWIGTTVEDQQRANERIPHLLAVPAAIRFLSCEPLLGPVDLRSVAYRGDSDYLLDVLAYRYRGRGAERHSGTLMSFGLASLGRIAWVIIGGESGPKHRPMDLAWAASLRDQCAEAGVAVWFKQAGGLYPGRGTDALGREYHEFPALAGVSR